MYRIIIIAICVLCLTGCNKASKSNSSETFAESQITTDKTGIDKDNRQFIERMCLKAADNVLYTVEYNYDGDENNSSSIEYVEYYVNEDTQYYDFSEDITIKSDSSTEIETNNSVFSFDQIKRQIDESSFSYIRIYADSNRMCSKVVQYSQRTVWE